MNDIHEFFAVTLTSVYVIKDARENGCPIVEKIAMRRASPIPIGGRLKNGSHVGIMGLGIILYSPSKGAREPELANTSRWGGHTSPIVALLLEKDSAIKCLDSKNVTACDPRWKKETLETLQKIGNDHPVFIPSATEGLSRYYQ